MISDAKSFYEQSREVLKQIGARTFIARECNDKSVGLVRDMIFPFKYEDVEKTIGARRIFLILESPHNAELRIGQDTAPAKGKTGKNIQFFWHDLFGCQFDDMKLCLVNAVKYQCSLGLPMSRFSGVKDEVFLWASKALMTDLMDRLQRYELTADDYVVIACSIKKNMCENVETVVSGILKGKLSRVFSPMYHPVSWEKHLKDAQLCAEQALKQFGMIHSNRRN